MKQNKQETLVRKNIRMSPSLARWFENKAAELGVSQTNIRVIALNEYRKQEDTVAWMRDVDDLMEKMDKWAAHRSK